MTKMSEASASSSSTEPSREGEMLYYCERHGVMNKSIDLREKADQISKKA
jgi:hypothetical protein